MEEVKKQEVESLFVPYREALALKELEFDELCFAGYSTLTEKIEFYSKPLLTRDSFTVDAPTYSQAFRFFREKYKYLVSTFSTESEEGKVIYYFEIGKVDKFTVDIYSDDKSTYEEAELACLRKLIEIVKDA
jgi:hypothetical protein